MVGIERKAVDLRARQFQQRDAEAAPLLQFQGLVAGIGAHHAAAAGTQPMIRLQLLLQQRQQARQITGKAAAAKDQRQVRLAHALEAASHLIDGLLQGGLRGEGRAG